jgi:hypothetical protein
MINTGHVLEEFNTSLVTPIPKKGALKQPSDYRPISVSSTFALLFEALLLKKLTILLAKK